MRIKVTDFFLSNEQFLVLFRRTTETGAEKRVICMENEQWYTMVSPLKNAINSPYTKI